MPTILKAIFEVNVFYQGNLGNPGLPVKWPLNGLCVCKLKPSTDLIGEDWTEKRNTERVQGWEGRVNG